MNLQFQLRFKKVENDLNSAFQKAVLIFTFLFISQMLSGAPTYQVSLIPHGHYAIVEMQVTPVKTGKTSIYLPVWTPGSYLVREYAKNIDSVTIRNQVDGIKIRKVNKNTWEINHPVTLDKPITVRYRVYCFELAVRNAYIDQNMAYINGAAVFIVQKGQEKKKGQLAIQMPLSWEKWTTALGSSKSGAALNLSFSNYDELVDSPIQLGNHDVIQYEVLGIPHTIGMVNASGYDSQKLIADFSLIAKEEAAIFGHHPCPRYDFIVHHLPNGSGGLEHKNSTTLQAKADIYKPTNLKAYRDYLGLVSHEYFHLWNVKRLRPTPLGPLNYNQENYTSLLWVAEGFTAYYDDLVLVRAGLRPDSEYLDIVAGSISYAQNSIGSKVQSLAESSFDAWIKFYRPDANSGNTTSSYYTKGSIAALYLDLLIIKNSDAKYSLDDVMKEMYQTYFQKLNRPYTEEELKTCLEKYAGQKLDAFFKDCIHGTKLIDVKPLLLNCGIELVSKPNDQMPWLGVNARENNKKWNVMAVQEGGPAWLAGISPGDEITKITANGTDITSLADLKMGVNYQITYNRLGLPTSVALTPVGNPYPTWKLQRVATPNASQEAANKKWLTTRVSQ